MRKKTRNRWLIAGAVVVLLVIAGLVGTAGCGDDGSDDFAGVSDYDSRDYMVDEGVAYEMEEVLAGEAMAPAADQSMASDKNTGAGVDVITSGFEQKIIKQGTLRIEIEKGGFDSAFDQAQLLATRYGGFVLSSSRYESSSGDGDETYMGGTVTISVAVDSFELAMSEARKLGDVQMDEINTQDVTQEYVDLEASIRNQQAYVDSLQALLARAKTMDEILQVQQILVYAQEQLEQLKGRMQYLEGRTTYSQITVSLYEAGAQVEPPGEGWGFVEALKDALHNVVDAFSAVARGLGWIIPVIIILGIIVGIAYPIARATSRRTKSKDKTDQPSEDS